MITGSNLFGFAVTYRSRLTQFSKLIYATVVSKVLLQSHLFGGVVNFDVIFDFRLRSIIEGFVRQSE